MRWLIYTNTGRLYMMVDTVSSIGCLLYDLQLLLLCDEDVHSGVFSLSEYFSISRRCLILAIDVCTDISNKNSLILHENLLFPGIFRLLVWLLLGCFDSGDLHALCRRYELDWERNEQVHPVISQHHQCECIRKSQTRDWNPLSKSEQSVPNALYIARYSEYSNYLLFL